MTEEGKKKGSQILTNLKMRTFGGDRERVEWGLTRSALEGELSLVLASARGGESVEVGGENG